MEIAHTLVYFLLATVAVGLIATLFMTLFVEAITKTGLIEVDMVRVIGSIFTKSVDSAFLVGSILHGISGVVFAIIYTIFFMFLNVQGMWGLMGAGLSIGAFHGFVLSFMLVVSVAEHHPIEEYRKGGFGVAAGYIAGHMVYGTVVGFLTWIFGFPYFAVLPPS